MKEKKLRRIFFHQVCFIELKTNKSMIRQVMQYFMRTFHSTALPFISFVWVLDCFSLAGPFSCLLHLFCTFKFCAILIPISQKEMSWTNWNMIFVASFVGGKWRFKSLIKFVQCNKRLEKFWGKVWKKSLEKIKINWKNVKKRRN